jgi:hypothetical protein
MFMTAILGLFYVTALLSKWKNVLFDIGFLNAKQATHSLKKTGFSPKGKI